MQYPQSPTIQHRVHPTLSVLGKECKRALNKKREPRLSKITTTAIDKRCTALAVQYPHYPPILFSNDLSDHAASQAPQTHWWKPRVDSDDGKSRMLTITITRFTNLHCLQAFASPSGSKRERERRLPFRPRTWRLMTPVVRVRARVEARTKARARGRERARGRARARVASRTRANPHRAM
jgi:hypothetical protein